MNEDLINESLVKEVQEGKAAGLVGYMARAMVQATLPHKETPGGIFSRSNGAYKLTIMSPNGLPYGSIPRLLLSWVTTEALYTRSPVLELGHTLSAFMAELGLTPSGGAKGDITRFKKQTVRLFSSAVSCQYTEENRDKGVGFLITDKYDLWWDPKTPNQIPLWKSTVTLSTNFFKEIIDRPVPVDMAALKVLKRSPMGLDIYCWLTYRLSYLQKETIIPWPLLQLQFGSDYAQDAEGLRNFKKKFLLRLKKVLSIYDTAKVSGVEKGFLLKPSPPHVAKRPVAMLPRSRRGAASSEAAKIIAPALMGETDIRLNTETFEQARELAPGLDIYHLEREWREWIAKKGEMPKNPDAAFLGFCRRKVNHKKAEVEGEVVQMAQAEKEKASRREEVSKAKEKFAEELTKKIIEVENRLSEDKRKELLAEFEKDNIIKSFHKNSFRERGLESPLIRAMWEKFLQERYFRPEELVFHMSARRH
jgi:hypothetical protein